MKIYEIQKINYTDYPYAIFSTSYQNPIEDIVSIEEELSALVKGKVIFDLLLSNGLAANRFIEAEFDGSKFNYETFKPLDCVDECIVKKFTEFYSKNESLLKNGILSAAQQFLIKKGRI